MSETIFKKRSKINKFNGILRENHIKTRDFFADKNLKDEENHGFYKRRPYIHVIKTSLVIFIRIQMEF